MVVMVLSLMVVSGCFRRPLLSFNLDAPPQLLVEASRGGVIDGRSRFREIWCAIRDDHGKDLPEDRPCDAALLRLMGEPPPSGRPLTLGRARAPLRVVVVPGMYAECFEDHARAFSDGLEHLAEAHGYRTDLIMVSGRSSSQHNAREIRDAVMRLDLEAGERLLLVGHSKGSVDVLEALAAHPEIVPRVAAVVSVAGAINGSPLADGLRDFYAGLLRDLSLRGCDRGDTAAMDSLRRTERLAFLASARLPGSVRYFSVVGIAAPSETSRLLRPMHRRLSAIEPLNDGQVLWTDALIPGATLLGYVRADHWAIAMPFSRTSRALATMLIDRNAFPREVLLESIVRIVEESL